MKKVNRKLFALLVLSAFLVMNSCSDYFQDLKDGTDTIDVPYYVECWKQKLDGKTYELDVDASQELIGPAPSRSCVKPQSVPGFTAKEVKQQIIKRDGSTVIKVYYDRNTITYSFNANGGKWNDNNRTKTLSGLYGSTVPAMADPEKIGYDFGTWGNVEIPAVFGTEDLSFNANWIARSDTAYKVEHYQQNLSDSNYTLVFTDNLQGTTEAETEAAAKTYAGFTSQDFNQNSINADGSTVIKIYYNRNLITYTFNSTIVSFSDNTTSKTLQGLYGSSFTAPSITSRTGYSGAWNKTVPAVFGDTDTTFTTSWTPHKYYIVYNANGGSGSTATQTFTYDTAGSISGNAFSRTNWGFYSWNTASNGSGTTYSPGQSVSNLTSTNNATITLYAQWGYPSVIQHPNRCYGYVCDSIPLSYTITYSASVSNYSQTVYFNSGDAFSGINFDGVPIDATKDGVTWYCSVTAVNTAYGLRYAGSTSAQLSNRHLQLSIPNLTRQ